MKVLIAGASGMIGGLLVERCIHSPITDEIRLLVRKPLDFKHKKINEMVVDDFKDLSPAYSFFKDIEAAFFCIGAYSGQLTDAAFKEITVDYADAFTDAIQRNCESASYCFLSGQGADLTESSSLSFAKYKGMAENYILKSNLQRINIFRPSYIYPVQKRKEPNILYTIMRIVYPVVKLAGKNKSITSVQLADAMFKAGITGANKGILENAHIIDYIFEN